jgi:hypothetical protein
MADAKAAPKAVELREGDYTFLLSQKIDPATKDRPPYQPYKELSPSAMAFDPTLKVKRKIRVVDGAPTIFADEQIEKYKLDNKWCDDNAWRPAFVFGVLRLNYPIDSLKLQALMMRDDFGGKESRDQNVIVKFDLENKEIQSKSNLDFAEQKSKAMAAAFEAIKDFDSIEAHATHLGIVYAGKTPDQIKEEYVKKAETDPVVFLKHMASPVSGIQLAIKKAIEAGVIDLESVKGEAKWKDTGTTITKVSIEKPLESLFDFALKNVKFTNKLAEYATSK